MPEPSRGLAEVVIAGNDAARWAPRNEYVWKLARWLHAHAPRGKGWLPRHIGRLAGERLRAEVRTASGGRLVVDPASLDVFAFIHTNGGLWEGHDIAACRAVLDPGQVFFDVGANAGVFSIEIAASFRDAIDVRAFEPQPSLAKSLVLSAALSGFRNVHVYAMILGDSVGEGELFVGASSIHASVVARDAGSRSLPCPKTSIDAEVGRGSLPAPDVIKMDVEGGELSVVRGALETLARQQPCLVFESDVNQERFGYTRADLCRELRRAAGYRFFAVERGGGYTPLDHDGNGPVKLADSVLAVPERRYDPRRLGQ